MLTLHNVRINLQNLGTILGIFLVGKSKKAIEERYFSFYNHQGTGGELEWWSDTCALFWIHSDRHGTADEKLRWALAEGALAELRNKREQKGHDYWPEACALAAERYDSIEHVTWYRVTAEWSMYDFGTSVHAEKGTGNFDDDVLSGVLNRGTLNKENLGGNKGNAENSEPIESETEDETESVGENV